MLCHQRTQLHSAFTVLDGGCCPSIFVFVSLCLYIFFFFSVDVEIVFALVVSLEISEWDCVWAKCEWANGRARWRAWGGLSVRILFKETNACTSRGACGLVRVWDSPPSVVSAFSHLSTSALQKTVKCQVLWVFVFLRTFLLVSDSMWMLCLFECSTFSLLPPFLCEVVMFRSGLYGVGDSESELKFASELRGWCGECLTSSHRKIVFEVLTNAFFYVLWLEGKSEIKTDFD